MKKVVNRIHEKRMKQNMTQTTLSRLSGVSQNAISQYEKGEKIPRIDYALMLAKTLKCTAEELFEIVDI